jgi:hypothetical protein
MIFWYKLILSIAYSIRCCLRKFLFVLFLTTAYNDKLEANLNNNLQEQGDIDQQIKIITDALIDAQKEDH